MLPVLIVAGAAALVPFGRTVESQPYFNRAGHCQSTTIRDCHRARDERNRMVPPDFRTPSRMPLH